MVDDGTSEIGHDVTGRRFHGSHVKPPSNPACSLNSGIDGASAGFAGAFCQGEIDKFHVFHRFYGVCDTYSKRRVLKRPVQSKPTQ